MKEQNREYLVILILPILMILFSFMLNTPYEILKGEIDIIKANNILISDYFVITNKGATFFNAGIIAIINVYIIYKLKLRLNGLLIMSVFIVLSFGFMGKNIYNIIPFYIGSYIYSRVFKKRFKTVIAIAMMSTTLAPIVSALHGYGFLIGILVGFVMPIISKQTLHYHNGYNLYNTGLAGGLLGIIIYSLLSVYGIKFDLNSKYYEIYDNRIFYFFILYFTILLIIGVLNSKDFIINTQSIYKHSGRLVTDFVQKEGFYTVVFNMGALGITLMLITKVYMLLNGPVICSMLTIVAFGGFGKHLKNTLPLMIGVMLAEYLFKIRIESTVFVMTMFFSTTLAPISGKFGIIAGIFAGILHYALAIQIGIVHGGINLYNNGLAAGMLASVYVPIIEEIKGGVFGGRTKEKNNKNDR